MTQLPTGTCTACGGEVRRSTPEEMEPLLGYQPSLAHPDVLGPIHCRACGILYYFVPPYEGA